MLVTTARASAMGPRRAGLTQPDQHSQNETGGPHVTPRASKTLPVGLIWIVAVCFAVLAAAGPVSKAHADGGGSSDAANNADSPLVVLTREAPPFAMRDEDGQWVGIGIDLWSRIAGELGLDYELREATLAEMIDEVAAGRADASVAALTITAEREARVDFTHSFYPSGLGIAVVEKDRAAWLAVVGAFFSVQFLGVLALLVLILLVFGILVWIFERRKNAEQFAGSPVRGLGAGFWWSAVTMTTVGYGDKSPITLGGRTVALVWMFTSVIIISGFTASIASALTVSGLSGRVTGPEDLPRVRAGAVAGSTGESYLRRAGVRREAYGSLAEALSALEEGKVEAVVHDAPILMYETSRHEGGLRVLPAVFDRQQYGIALRPGSELRAEINQALLTHIASEEWQQTVQRWLTD